MLLPINSMLVLQAFNSPLGINLTICAHLIARSFNRFLLVALKVHLKWICTSQALEKKKWGKVSTFNMRKDKTEAICWIASTNICVIFNQWQWFVFGLNWIPLEFRWLPFEKCCTISRSLHGNLFKNLKKNIYTVWFASLVHSKAMNWWTFIWFLFDF